jgi:hypothetical protein
MALLDAATVREYLPSLTGSGEDSALVSLVARFQALAAAHCGYPAAAVGGNPTLEVVTYTLYLDGTGTKYLQLPVSPVTGITTLHVDADREYGSSQLVSSGDYDLFGDKGQVILKVDSTQGEWDAGSRTVKAVFTAGYSTTPMAVKHACAMQVAYWWQARAHLGKTSVSQGAGSSSVSTLILLPEVRQALEPYRLGSALLG